MTFLQGVLSLRFHSFLVLVATVILDRAAEATDIIALHDVTCHESNGDLSTLCTDIKSGHCCSFAGTGLRSVLFEELPTGAPATAYTFGGCSHPVNRGQTGPGKICVSVVDPTGGRYLDVDEELDSNISAPCTYSVRPDALRYSTGSKGHWLLKVGSTALSDVISQFLAVPLESKADWLERRGARFVPNWTTWWAARPDELCGTAMSE